MKDLIYCSRCGYPLTGVFKNNLMHYEPCSICIDEAYNNGYNEGLEQGYFDCVGDELDQSSI